MHPTVTAAYMLALVAECSDSEGLDPATDNPSPHLSPAEGIAAAIRLLSGGSVGSPPGRQRGPSVANFAMLAIQSVVPRDLSGASVEQILDIKDKLGGELDGFRAFVAAQQPELQRLASVHSQEIQAEAFAVHINSEIKEPVERLEQIFCAISNLRRLRDEAAHRVGGEDITASQAKEYLELVDRVLDALKSFHYRNTPDQSS